MSYRLDLSFKNCQPSEIYKHIEDFEECRRIHKNKFMLC